MTGADLRARRLAAGVSAAQLARALGVSRPRISNIEALALVTPEAEMKYLVALKDTQRRVG